jgi:hypothetical protein
VGEVRVAWAEIAAAEKVEFCAKIVNFFVFTLADRPTTMEGFKGERLPVFLVAFFLAHYVLF